MSRLEPRRVGLAAAPAPLALAQASTDLANQFTAVVAAGDQYLAAGETANALDAYKAAGATGATSIGPEIDLAGFAAASQPFTQQAWRINVLLQATTAPQDAQAFVKNMQLRYREAIDAATLAATSPPAGPPSLGASQVAWFALIAAVTAGTVALIRGAS